jgi:signal transduction histidine kinase
MPLTVIRGLSAARRFDPDPSQVRHAREWAHRALPGWGLIEHADLVELLVSELVTNAIVHGSGPVDVCLSYGGELRIEVRDQGAGMPAQRQAAADDPGGRGLSLVDAISSSWGVTDTCGGEPGKTVYAVVAVVREQAGSS